MWDSGAPHRGWPFPASAPPKVRRGSAFTEWLISMTSELVRSRLAEMPGVEFSEISSALSEAFDNADQWGRPLDKTQASFRLMRMEWSARTPAELRRLGAGDSVISRYAQRSADSGSTALHAEYSVVDAGPGVFSRRLRTLGVSNPGFLDQARALQSVLAEGVTDDATGAGEERGRGFTNIFTALTRLGGALRLRTGSLALSRDFAHDPLLDSERSRPRLFDASTGELELTPHPAVAGTALSLIVPTQIGS